MAKAVQKPLGAPRADCNWRCCGCGRRWSSPPRGIADVCPSCGGTQIEWTNFEQWRHAPERSAGYRRVALGEEAHGHS